MSKEAEKKEMPLGATAIIFNGKRYGPGEELPKEHKELSVPRTARAEVGQHGSAWKEMDIAGTSGSGKPEPGSEVDYSKMTKDELAEEAKRRNVVVEGNTKADYIKALGG